MRISHSILFVVLTGWVALASAQPDLAFSGYTLERGVLVDRAAGQVYFSLPEGGVEARQIDDGSVVWQNLSIQQPLAASNGTLLAQSNSPQRNILALQFVQSNGSLLPAINVPMDNRVKVVVADELEYKFRFVQEPDNLSQLIWKFEYRLAQGIPPDAAPGSPESGVFELNGVLNIDLGALNVDLQTLSEAPQLQTNYLTDKLGPKDGRQFLSKDKNHVVHSRRHDLADLQKRFQWTIYTSEGERLGDYFSPTGFTYVMVTDGVLLLVTPEMQWLDGDTTIKQPKAIRAIDLETGAEIWQAAIKEYRYMGPWPV